MKCDKSPHYHERDLEPTERKKEKLGKNASINYKSRKKVLEMTMKACALGTYYVWVQRVFKTIKKRDNVIFPGDL